MKTLFLWWILSLLPPTGFDRGHVKCDYYSAIKAKNFFENESSVPGEVVYIVPIQVSKEEYDNNCFNARYNNYKFIPYGNDRVLMLPITGSTPCDTSGGCEGKK